MAEPAVKGADAADLQGVLRFGHGHLPEAAFLLLDIADPAAARAWLAGAEITSAGGGRPETARQVAFSHEGLRRLGLPEAVLAGFSDEFIAGMARDANRSRRLGDIGANAPADWLWGGSQCPDVVLLLFAGTGGLAALIEATRQSLTGAFKEVGLLSTAPLLRDASGRTAEPFGFADGISQPAVDWFGTLEPQVIEPEYRNVAALGEFVLGYPNEYGRYTDRPLVDPADDPEGLLPAAADEPTRRDLGRDGSYLVLRDLRQDVAGFWAWLESAAEKTGLTAMALAEAMVGRRADGTPSEPAAGQAIAGVHDDALNRFTYQSDPMGLQCPLGAHIRRANPRNPDMPGASGGRLARLAGTLGFLPQGVRDDLAAPTRFHRLLRRGRAYGAEGTAERGLRFVCLNANIARQFEFVQTAWMAGTKFGGVTGEADPLLGNRCPIARQAVDTFSIPQPSGAPLRLRGIPQFVTVQGGGYFFLPSLPALRYLSRIG